MMTATDLSAADRQPRNAAIGHVQGSCGNQAHNLSVVKLG